MTTILFWNINKKPLLQEIVFLCHANKVDILVLAECQLSDVAVLQAINPNLERKYLEPLVIGDFNMNPFETGLKK